MSVSKEKRTQNTEDRSFYIKVIVAVIIFAIIFAVCFLYSNENIRKNMTAVTIDGEKFTATELDYYYHTAINQYGSYLSYLGVDPSQDLDSQKYSGNQSWADYFRSEAVVSLTQTATMYHDAMENGYTIDEDLQKQIDDYSASIDKYCETNAITRDQFLQSSYGSHMTNDLFMKHLTMSFVASDYASDYNKNHEYSTDELTTYYNDHKQDIDLASYEVLTVMPDYTGIDGTTENSTDEPTYTEAQEQQALDAAEKTAAAFLDRVNKGEALSEIAKEYNENAYSSKEDVSYSSFKEYSYNDWVFDETRKIGDAGMMVDEANGRWYVVVLNDRYRPEYNTVDVRHILLKPTDSGLKEGDEGYEEALELNRAFAENKAKELLNKYRSGEKTSEAFAALAKENSADTASAIDGGLISKIYKGAMVDSFEDWCFDASRKPGDTGIVESEYGYHVMYFQGENAPYWQVRCMNNLYTEWEQSIYEGAKTKTHMLGIKAIG